mgnify:CR=1 FL=1
MKISIEVNGEARSLDVEGRTLLVEGPGGSNFSDLWWRHGALLLRDALRGQFEIEIGEQHSGYSFPM